MSLPPSAAPPRSLLQPGLARLAPWLAIQRGRETPAPLLVLGADGVGKRELVRLAAQALECLGAGRAPGDPVCGECPPCARFDSGHWVDFEDVAPAAVDGEAIKIEEIRALQAQAGRGPHSGRYRAIRLADADRLTPPAANALLKLLEEPPRSWWFLLTARDAGALLPTLVSRCQRVTLPPAPESALIEALTGRGVAPAVAARAAARSEGRWARAWAETQRTLETRGANAPATDGAWTDWRRSGRGGPLAERWGADDASAREALELLEFALHARLRATPAPELIEAFEGLQEARLALDSPVNRRLWAQAVLARLELIRPLLPEVL